MSKLCRFTFLSKLEVWTIPRPHQPIQKLKSATKIFFRPQNAKVELKTAKIRGEIRHKSVKISKNIRIYTHKVLQTNKIIFLMTQFWIDVFFSCYYTLSRVVRCEKKSLKRFVLVKTFCFGANCFVMAAFLSDLALIMRNYNFIP